MFDMPSSAPSSAEFQYFADPTDRAMIAECGFRVAEHLHDERIGSLVLVDRAARNLHIPIRAAWEVEYPGEPKPSVYFLNPGGFLNPRLHTVDTYGKMLLKQQAQDKGIPSQEEYHQTTKSIVKTLRVAHKARKLMYTDLLHNAELRHASELTALADTAIKNDPNFNGRVMVLDACTHTGSSLSGIAETLRAIGVIDVRTGVVNNTSNHGHNVDYVAFSDEYAPLACRPFGEQTGILLSTDKVPAISSDGISNDARQARRELYTMCEDISGLRETYTEDALLHTIKLPFGLVQIVENIVDGADGTGPSMQVTRTDRGITITLGGTENGLTNSTYDTVERPED